MVIVIGGLGSFPGAVVGGLIAGEIVSITSAFNSAYSEVMLYAVMALLLVVRPQGLFGTEGPGMKAAEAPPPLAAGGRGRGLRGPAS